ncbi:MAG TPA: hydantoinase B/oxoprolinase family protein [Thermoleophilaceae bacterium]|nr:hydantoinase B/oxoprolinase family protein [Thermoleophilaceae bacterium]
MSDSIDVITLSVVWTRLVEICEEMGAALRKTAFSPAIREAEDCGVGLFDRRGRLLAQGVFTPGQVGSMPFALQHALDAYPAETLRPGDGIVLNDPYMGNGHLPDIFCFAPVYSDDELVGYAGSCAHHMDVGGAAPGSQATVGIFDMHQEGIRITPVRAFVGGDPVREVLELVTANVRKPDDTAGDLRAQMTTCLIGARRLVELYDEYGEAVIEGCMDELIARTETGAREAVSAIPDGRYEFEDYLDDWGPDTDPVRIAVAVDVSGDEITVDFTGTGPAVRAALNCPYNFTYAYSLFAVKALTDATLPENEGGRRPLTVIAPEGCFLNPIPPAPTGARATVAIRIVDAIMGALSQALPERAVAAPSHFVNTTFGGVSDTGEPFVYYELLIGGVGGRAHSDGVDGLVSCFNTSNIPVEIHEATSPVLVERLELLEDSGGPGLHRGGVGIRKVLRVLAGPVRLTNLADRQVYPAWGLFDGEPGAIGSVTLSRNGHTEVLHSKTTRDVAAGDILDYRVAGAGGWGRPFARDPDAVLDDVIDGLVSVAAAEERYGVVVDRAAGEVDLTKTAERRKESK